MAFLRNDAINRVNLHSGIQALAQAAGGIFFIVFMLRSGVPVPAALLAQAAIVAGRFVLRPAILPIAKRYGLKPILITGTLGVAVQYPVLAEVQGVGGALLALCVVTSLGEIFYWVAYNAYFSAIGDNEHRGHQIGAREAIVAVANIVAPLLGAWALVSAGPRWTFAVVGVVQALAVLPLLGAPNVAIKREAPGVFRAAWPAAVIVATDGWFDAIFFFVWQIALFVALDESITAYGGAMALAGVAGAVGGLAIGRTVDLGNGRRAILAGYGFAALVVVLRAASLDLPLLAVTANALGAVVLPLMLPALGKATYSLAKLSPCPLRFHLATEGGWDIGCLVPCLVVAGLYAAGVPLEVLLLLALPPIALGGWLLGRQYPAG